LFAVSLVTAVGPINGPIEDILSDCGNWSAI
jgi:hypothetical protein